MGVFTISVLNLLLLKEEMNHVLQVSVYLHFLWRRSRWVWLMLSVFGEMNFGLHSHFQMSNPFEWTSETLYQKVLEVCHQLRFWKFCLWYSHKWCCLAEMDFRLFSKQISIRYTSLLCNEEKMVREYHQRIRTTAWG